MGRITVIKEATDRYGRVVGRIIIDKREVSALMSNNGYTWLYPQYCKIPACKEWKELEIKAREEKRGLWQTSDPINPWEWRKMIKEAKKKAKEVFK